MPPSGIPTLLIPRSLSTGTVLGRRRLSLFLYRFCPRVHGELPRLLADLDVVKTTSKAAGMSGRMRVSLYGNSLVSAVIAASLVGEDEFEVIRLPEPLMHLSEATALDPDVISSTRKPPAPRFLFSALEKSPDFFFWE